MEKKLLKNLQAYLTSLATLSAIPVIIHDINTEKPDPPLIVLGSTKTDIHPFLGANAVIDGFCLIGFRGTQDPTQDADAVSDAVTAALQSESLYTALNAPLSGSDTRPSPAFTLELLSLTGNRKEEDEYSLSVFIEWQAYIANVD